MNMLRLLLTISLISTLAFAQGSLPLPKGGQTIYVVRPGDSLWNITDRFFGDPFLWPRLWSINPYIDNPHLIYPGDVITLTDLPIVKFDPKARDQDLIDIAPPAPVFYFSLGGSEGFVSHKKWEHMGRILTSEPPHILLGRGDIVWISIGTDHGAMEGDKFTIFRTSKEVIHPITGRRAGYKVGVFGEVEIIEVAGKRKSVARITDSSREISRGAKLRPKEPFVKEVVLRKGQKFKQGFVIANKKGVDQTGKGDVVYIDLGKKNNIVPGNTFSIYRHPRKSYDPDKGSEVKIPGPRVGRAVVLSVQDNSSTAIVMNSKRIIVPRDIAVLDL